MKKILTGITISLVIIPGVVFASWWNPMTWFKQKSKSVQPAPLQVNLVQVLVASSSNGSASVMASTTSQSDASTTSIQITKNIDQQSNTYQSNKNDVVDNKGLVSQDKCDLGEACAYFKNCTPHVFGNKDWVLLEILGKEGDSCKVQYTIKSISPDTKSGDIIHGNCLVDTKVKNNNIPAAIGFSLSSSWNASFKSYYPGMSLTLVSDNICSVSSTKISEQELGDKRNEKRVSGMRDICVKIVSYAHSNNGTIPSAITSSNQEICADRWLGNTCTNLVNLKDISYYGASIEDEPNAKSPPGAGYKIKRNGNIVTISAQYPDNNKTIEQSCDITKSVKEIPGEAEYIKKLSDSRSAPVDDVILKIQHTGDVVLKNHQVQSAIEKIEKTLVTIHPAQGIVLPPMPNKIKNNNTLAGIDSNSNGVRDDVERYLGTRAKSLEEFNYYVLNAKAEQKKITNPDPKSEDEILKVISGTMCAWNSSNKFSITKEDELVGGTLEQTMTFLLVNTSERKKAWQRFQIAHLGSDLDKFTCDDF